MTIGPEPMTRILRRSSLRGNQSLHEPIEEVQSVMRPRAGLRVVLHGRARHVAQDQALDRAVVQVQLLELRDAEVRLPAHGLVGGDRSLAVRAEHREAVVLRGDLDSTRLQVLHRVVRAAMAERQLEGVEPDRPAEQLVAEADAPHRDLSDDAAYGLDDVVERRRVTRAVGEEDRVGLASEELLGAGAARVELQVDATLA